MSNYIKEQERTAIRKDYLAAIARGDESEIERLGKRLWANAHGQANEDRREGR